MSVEPKQVCKYEQNAEEEENEEGKGELIGGDDDFVLVLVNCDAAVEGCKEGEEDDKVEDIEDFF